MCLPVELRAVSVVGPHPRAAVMQQHQILLVAAVAVVVGATGEVSQTM